MFGEKTLNETKAQIRDAFANEGIDVETWLDQQMVKLEQGPNPNHDASETFRLLRDGMQQPSKAKQELKRKTKKANSKK